MRTQLLALLSLVLVVTLAPEAATAVEPQRRAPVREVAEVPSVAVRPVDSASVGPSRLPIAADRPAPVWPKAGTSEALLGPGRRGGFFEGTDRLSRSTRRIQPGGLPVSLTPHGNASSAKVRVEVLDRAATTRAGVRGVVLRATNLTKGTRGAVQVTVDYSAFATAYGGDWANRLRLVAMPECALITPGAEDCQGLPLPSTNNASTRTVSADVPMASGSVLMSIQAGPSGSTGDYQATKLQPSSTWSAGGNSGAFTWSYPMRVPPAVAGPKPALSLSYSSQSVDGRHAATNNQPSWVGEGFDFWPGGYIERRYGGCGQDMENGANNTVETGDQCWVTDNATISLEGSSGELLYNATDQRWHLRGDNGSRIERKTGASNGDDDGEYWVLTDSSGTQFWFGANRLPGWDTGDPVTNSAWTVPVFGNHSGEPCHATAFADSDCTQVWRWNLDYVVDVHGNSMSFWYDTETNLYKRNATPSDAASYVRDGYLTHIAYGTRTDNDVDSVFDTDAPAKTVFAVADRCLAGCATKDATHWPDTPWDQNCTTGPCATSAPTFFSTKRLASVTTQVLDGSSYRDVERWTFTHAFPDPGDGTRAGLWLEKISHTGLVGGTATTPDITFTPVSLDNRVDAIDSAPAMAWHRIARIDNETGGAISITYSSRDCETTKPVVHDNTSRCYPSMWTREGDSDPTIDWFHKYVVTDVLESDLVGGQPSVTYHYDYIGDPAWHYTDDDGLIQDENKTWSVFRGYGKVGVTVGNGDDIRTYTETSYFRGMHGDRLPTGTRSVNVVDSRGVSRADDDWLAGRILEKITYVGPGGAEESGTIHEPWVSAPTASRTIDGVTVHARMIKEGTTIGWAALDGGRPDRVTKKTMQYDAYGMATQVEDFGEDGVAGDEQCVRNTYEPRNTTRWLTALKHQVETFAVDCTAAGTPASLGDDDVISIERTLYDGNAYLAAPDEGLATSVQEASAWNSGSPSFVTVGTTTYDVHGRALVSRDALNRPTTTAYTPLTGGPVTATSVTNALNHETTTTVDPAFGLPVSTVDANGKRTDLAYDPLGRLTGVWLPGRDKTTESASSVFGYDIRQDKVSSVTSQTLNPSGGYVTSHALFDGLLREVQTQSPSPSGGRILTNTFYDTLGRAWQTYGTYYNTQQPSTDLVIPVEPHDIPTQNRTLFDGAGRTVAEVFRPYDVERWRTSTYYAGDRTDVTPPDGGVATSKVTDARGQVVELWQYDGPAPVGPHSVTTFEYNRKGQMVAAEDPAGNRWTYTFDLRGRQIEATDPDKGLTKTTYDNAGQVTYTTDGRNIRLAYKYDQLGRKTGVYYNYPFGTPLAAWAYDTVAKGQLFQSVRYVSGQPYVRKINGYTDRYQPTSVSITIPSAETGLGGTYTTAYTYYANGAPKATTWEATADLPAESVTTEYDGLGNPTRLLNVLGTVNSSYVTNTFRDALGLVDQYEFYTGLYSGVGDKVRLTFDRELETSRLTQAWVEKDTAPYTVTDTSYSYDHAGNVLSIKDAISGDNQCFDYDQLRRLTEAWTPGNGDCLATRSVAALGGPAPYWTSWTFDQVGSRLTQVRHDTGGDTTTGYDYPAAGGPRPHTLTSTTVNGAAADSWSYDNAGNTTSRPGPGGQQTLIWDKEGHLASVTDDTTAETTSYIYDADGNRLIAKDSGSKTLWLPGQEIRYNIGSGMASCTRYYGFDGQTIASRNAAGLTWLASNHQGTAQVSIDEATQNASIRRQSPYGEARGSQPSWPNGKGFVGGDIDPTGLIHLNAREYDAAIGRFISVDPIMDLNDPQQIHGYAYSHNSPVTFSDPSGLYDFENADGSGDRRYGGADGTYVEEWVPPPCDADCQRRREEARQRERERLERERKARECQADFWCRTGKWLVDHKETILTTAAAVGFVACMVATAGVCGAVALGVAAISIGYRTADFLQSEKTAADIGAFAVGVATDIVLSRIPAAKVSIPGRVKPPRPIVSVPLGRLGERLTGAKTIQWGGSLNRAKALALRNVGYLTAGWVVSNHDPFAVGVRALLD